MSAASGSAMEVAVRSVTFPIQAQGLKDTPTAKAISERHKSWEERLPKDRADLWDWLTTLTGDDQAAQGELERLSPVSVDQRARGRMTVHIEWLAVEEGSAK